MILELSVAAAAVLLGLLYRGIDRRLAARMQARVGPPLLQPFTDIRKLMAKENVVPRGAVEWIYNSAPVVSLAASLMVLMYVPLGPLGAPMGGQGGLILVVYLFALSALALVAGGFASNSPYSSIGAQREMVMMMSYELPLAMVALGFAWKVGSFSIEAIAATPVWGSVGPLGAVGFALFGLMMLFIIPAMLSKVPFDSPEAETELGGGLLTEYSGRNLAMFHLADAAKAFAVGSLAVALFLPFQLGVAPWAEMLWFLAKIFAVLFASVTLMRVSAARLQIDRASGYYWKHMSALGLLGLVLIMAEGAL